MRVSEPVWSQDSKNVIFLSERCLEMLKVAVRKNDVISGYGFWAICLPKIDTSSRNSACQMCRHGSTTYCTVFENSGFCKKFYKKFSFLTFRIKNHFWKIRERHFKVLFILRCLVHFICILLNIAIIGNFWNIYKLSTKDGLTLGHLHRYNSKRFRKFSKFCVKTKIDVWRGMPGFASI